MAGRPKPEVLTALLYGQRAGSPRSLALLELQKQIYHHGHF
jgi:hypothetical protein